jgi:hypothetical protein
VNVNYFHTLFIEDDRTVKVLSISNRDLLLRLR